MRCTSCRDIKKNEDGTNARQHLAKAIQGTWLTSGVMSKCQGMRCNDKLVQRQRNIGQKNRTRRRPKYGRRLTGGGNAVCKHVISKFNNRQDKYKALITKTKGKERYNVADLKIWCSVMKEKDDRVITSKLDKVRAYTMMLERWELSDIK